MQRQAKRSSLIDKSYPITRAAVVAMLVGAMLVAIELSPAGETIDVQFTRNLLYRVRSALGRDATVDPRLRIYSLDDKSLTAVGTDSPPLSFWTKVLVRLQAAQPRAILVAKAFRVIEGVDEGGPEFVKQLLASPVPVYAAAFHARKIESVESIDALPASWGLTVTAAQAPATSAHLLYGPPAKMREGMRGIGMMNYAGSGRAEAFFHPPKVDFLVPHISMFAAEKLELNENGLFADGKPVPVDENGSITPDFLDVEKLYAAKHVYPLKSLIRETVSAGVLPVPGDIVVILMDDYSGGASLFADTPRGAVTRGTFLASCINSVLKGTWETQVRGRLALLILAVILGALGGARLRAGVLAVGAGVFILVLCGVTVLAFLTSLTVIPWLTTAFGFGLSSVAVYVRRAQAGEMKSRLVHVALEGILPPEKVDMIARQPEKLKLDASEQNVSVMFVDMVGFSRVTEIQTPKEAFETLQGVLQMVVASILANGGVVDKCLGDGVLCYFGLSLVGKEDNRDHAERALNAAIDIQRKNLDLCLRSAMNKQPVFPIRIGINSGDVYFGDVGGKGRIEFTCIGNGVNMGQRYEAACEPFMVMVGPQTKDMLPKEYIDSRALRSRLIQMKHHRDLVEAFEYDPFFKDTSKLGEAVTAYREFASITSSDQRWQLPPERYLPARTDVGPGEVTEVSERGLALELSVYLGKGVVLRLQLAREDRTMTVTGEIRWAREVGNGKFRHGVLLKDMSDDERQAWKLQVQELAQEPPKATPRLPPPSAAA